MKFDFKCFYNLLKIAFAVNSVVSILCVFIVNLFKPFELKLDVQDAFLTVGLITLCAFLLSISLSKDNTLDDILDDL